MGLDNLFVFRHSYSIFISRVLCEEFDELHCLRSAVPDVIKHAWSHTVDRKSEVYSQPVRINLNIIPYIVIYLWKNYILIISILVITLSRFVDKLYQLQHLYLTNYTQIILEDPKYLPSCVRILDAVSSSLGEIFSEAGRGEMCIKNLETVIFFVVLMNADCIIQVNRIKMCMFIQNYDLFQQNI